MTGGSRRSRTSPFQGAFFLVLTGLAGAGKTAQLALLAARGETVVDLEALANHRGSVFGGIGRASQPSHDAFAALVESAVRAAQPSQPIWIEDEGPFIGSVGVPRWLQDAIRSAPTAELIASFDARVDRLFAQYGDLPRPDLIAALHLCAPRAGSSLVSRAIDDVHRGDIRSAIALILPYYDRAYATRLASMPRRRIAVCQEPADPVASIAQSRNLTDQDDLQHPGSAEGARA